MDSKKDLQLKMGLWTTGKLREGCWHSLYVQGFVFGRGEDFSLWA